MNKGTPIYAAGKVVGHVNGDTFYKSVSSSRHQLRQPPAWALDLSSLRQAERAGAMRVELRDRDTGWTWRATVANIRKLGQPLNRGFGEQLALALPFWTVTKPGEAPAAVQMSLL